VDQQDHGEQREVDVRGVMDVGPRRRFGEVEDEVQVV
jgi:hypothetical protein